jgi:hypothetical protein
MTIEQRLAEIIRAFHTDTLSSTVNLNVDSTSCSPSWPRPCWPPCPPGCPATPPPPRHPPAPLPPDPGQITTTNDVITVRLERRAYSPVLRQADLPPTTVPWWGNRILRYEFA